jgi:hypothetical protein
MSVATFDCVICGLDVERPDHVVEDDDGDQHVCLTCCRERIIPMFESALKTESEHPPIYSIDAFVDLFTNEFLNAYRQKVQEYQTPIPRRVYCQARVLIAGQSQLDICGTFLGSSDNGGIKQCHGCSHIVCFTCKGVHCPSPNDHICGNDQHGNTLDQATRGREWQQCPNPDCNVTVVLHDGCNAMTCIRCSTNFCYICGIAVEHNSIHYQQVCPRWGQANSGHFDRPPIPEIPADGLINITAFPGQGFVFEQGPFIFEIDHQLRADWVAASDIAEEFELERNDFFPGGEEEVPQEVVDMRDALDTLNQNLDLLLQAWAFRNVAPQHEVMVREAGVVPIREGQRVDDFRARDAELSETFAETYESAVKCLKEVTVLVDWNLMAIFQRYEEVHRPAFYADLVRGLDG